MIFLLPFKETIIKVINDMQSVLEMNCLTLKIYSIHYKNEKKSYKYESGNVFFPNYKYFLCIINNMLDIDVS